MKIRRTLILAISLAPLTPTLAQPIQCSITATVSNTVFVSWSAVAGRHYEIHSATVPEGAWSNVFSPSETFTATSSNLGFSLPLDATARFFRIAELSTNSIPLDMAFIPAGTFTMGNWFPPESGESDQFPLHNVYVSAFYMDRYDVTEALWKSVYQWATNNGYSFHPGYPGAGKAANHPVQYVRWYDVLKWCNARSQKEGLNPCYYTAPSQVTLFTSGDLYLSNACVNWNANGYRLSTEAEWEKAARGGLSGQRFPWGNLISTAWANYSSTAGGYDLGPSGYNTNFNIGDFPYTSPVGWFAPNGYGLYDMAGNVLQMCWDGYNYSWYTNAAAINNDTRGPDLAVANNRVIRGGAWNYGAQISKCSYRSSLAPGNFDNRIGFRCVRRY